MRFRKTLIFASAILSKMSISLAATGVDDETTIITTKEIIKVDRILTKFRELKGWKKDIKKPPSFGSWLPRVFPRGPLALRHNLSVALPFSAVGY